KIEEELIPMPGQSVINSSELQGFEKAEEKAVKAVQKHSMVIDGFEKNKQIDEAYLLLGKSRYYLQRYIPALESFTFVLEKYPNANLYYETIIWKAKTHVRLKNEELAIETLDLVLKNIGLSEDDFEKAHTTMAMAYTQLDSTHLVIDHLKKSTYYFNDRSQSARNLFILGQVYREENKIDSSNMVFETLAFMKKIPQKYKVHAILERAKNYSAADSTDVIVYTLQDLIEDRDNRPYLDELYYQAGLIAHKNGNIDNANGFFENSVQFNTSKPYQKSLSYEKLGDLYFDKTLFETAGAYYDSVLQIPQDKNTKRIRRLIRKRESLNDVIYYENITSRNDSILSLSEMNPENQKIYFQNYIDSLKIKDNEDRKRKEQEVINADFGAFDNVGSKQNENDNSGMFYFYNVQLVGLGKQEFKNKYGNRPLADNWIISEKSGAAIANVNNKSINFTEENTQRYDVNYYLSQIPTNENQLDSIKKQRSDAYYNLGLIYKEQFKEFELATEDFENFLNKNPIQKLILPAYYQLYKTYANFDLDLSNKYRDKIVNEYPDSRYSEIIKNPNKVLVSANNVDSPEYIYKNAYICYDEEEYEYALTSINKAFEKYKGLEIESKFELLKAYITLKIKDESAFIERLNFVIINYPNTEESKHAESVLEKILSKSVKNKTKGEL
ncbi:MAG: tetratricopeptide repeat protein, partial [Flavobacteriaceae bacterium]|nr:tetratricopeptide repeat protein [Flavobacteriaceae bacterium]